ncbi:hypothetical protein, variant [Cladophialophora immunda]|uniref:Uncharacterized protein n=1 Tax=Cladophialophora immunda TaxID=569365 RepID=A0A0D2BX15_9EURO|nr:uncharacterized protein PV07_11837 [Cladophialophora immunda]XP_016243870.1 hypothetical protein, variant [Cladophialophora immunda]KIW23653.1 hypothetical protein PV07_11837 [Cladophialophora immunda]KIW23654.1 hypothetical protein, variant [Cladophialophora immunda]
MYHFQNKTKERSMSIEDRETYAATHHNTTEANLDHESMKVAKEIGQRRISNQVKVNAEGHPNLKYDIDPLEPDHSLPPSQRALYAKRERKAKGETPSEFAAATTEERKSSM